MAKVYLKDYQVPDFLVPALRLDVSLEDERAVVSSVLEVRWNPVASGRAKVLRLDGTELKLLELKKDGVTVPESGYALSEKALELSVQDQEESFSLAVKVEIDPYRNKSLMGLYLSGREPSKQILCSQCEAEGFRRITFFPDRPDVMSRYTVRIEGDKKRFPFLLSNGNKTGSGAVIQEGETEKTARRHWVSWEDPFPKPSYLFALAAGNFDFIEDRFQTASGRDVTLRIFMEKGQDPDQFRFAMERLKIAMRWDEERFGREYDLDLFMIVAVDDFNFGAMENKGLNIFNAAVLFGSGKTASDETLARISEVVAHEYFHNWTGDRITCRDWFQLTLKEGLTVFRDQEFSADTGNRTAETIKRVQYLKQVQFPEDAGPNSHPIRPPSYSAIDNFYTRTVYNKGAEVIRMFSTLLGEELFRRGTDRYFERFDGQAVTCDDFFDVMNEVFQEGLAEGKISAVSDTEVNSAGIPPVKNLETFRRWYDQKGTPCCRIQGDWNAEDKSYTLTIKQLLSENLPGSSGKKDDPPRNKPFLFPFSFGLLGKDGKELHRETVIVHGEEQSWRIPGIQEKPVPSLLRDFSAPLLLDHSSAEEEIALLCRQDSNPYNRYEATQQLFFLCLRDILKLQGENPQADDFSALSSFALLVQHLEQLTAAAKKPGSDLQFLSFLTDMPTLEEMTDLIRPLSFQPLCRASHSLKRALGLRLEKPFGELYQKLADQKEAYSFSPPAVGRRRLKNHLLSYLVFTSPEKFQDPAFRQFKNADNMSDEIEALRALSHRDSPLRSEALAQFEERWKSLSTVYLQWFAVQASAQIPHVLTEVKRLAESEGFHKETPNMIYALHRNFTRNAGAFHALTEEGNAEAYAFIADTILDLDSFNTSPAAILTKQFSLFPKMAPPYKEAMRKELERLAQAPKLSNQTREIVDNILASGASPKS